MDGKEPMSSADPLIKYLGIQGKNVSTINAYGHAVATPLLTIVHALVDLQFVVKIRFAEKETVSHFQT